MRIVTVMIVVVFIVSGCRISAQADKQEQQEATGYDTENIMPDEHLEGAFTDSRNEVVDKASIVDVEQVEENEVQDEIGEEESADISSVDSEDSFPDEEPASNEICSVLFGRPTDKTGLDESQCQPTCNCEGFKFTAKEYSEEEIAILESKTLINPPDELTENPYDFPEKYPRYPEKACAIVKNPANDDEYSLQTYDSPEAAIEDGAQITHYGACAQCSSLKNLAVYIKYNDLTGPVRKCGLTSTLGGENKNIECLMELGFDYPCAQIWYYNIKKTREKCLGKCLIDLRKPYHKEDGSLNDCIQCDEDESGEIFKAVSGRTRRNSGLPTSLCRPCTGLAPIYHTYYQ